MGHQGITMLAPGMAASIIPNNLQNSLIVILFACIENIL